MARQRKIAGRTKSASRSVRWPLGGEEIERRATRESLVAVLLAIVCVLGVAFGATWWERALLGVVAVVLIAHAFAKLAAGRRAALGAGFVVLDDGGVAREQASTTTPLAAWSSPFGVSLFASKSGDRGLIAFTSEGATRFLGVHVPDDEHPSAAILFDRSAVRADDDALFSQGVETSLRAANAAELLRSVITRDPEALNRLFLSSARGEPVTIIENAMRVAGREFDLRAPLEWRPFLFHEVAGHVTTIYQATWVRQESPGKVANEIVLVAPLPASSDVRLSSSLAETPPLREARVAIERLFMPFIRRALERSPRASRTSHAKLRSVAPAKGGASSGA